MDKQTFVSKVNSLGTSYKPSPESLQKLATVNLIALVGPTGAGKSTVCRQSGIPFVIGDTTRQPRENEVHGRDYNFRTDFDVMLGEIERGEYVQFVIERGNEVYGTRLSSYPAGGVCAMSILASVVPKFQSLGFGTVRPVYIVPPNHSEWMHRISAHKDKDLEARLMEAKDSLAIALQDPTFVFILNDNLESATKQLREVAAGKVNIISSNEARSAASQLYEHLQMVIR